MWFRIPEKQNLTVNRKNTGIHCQQLGLTQLIKGENFVLFFLYRRCSGGPSRSNAASWVCMRDSIITKPFSEITFLKELSYTHESLPYECSLSGSHLNEPYFVFFCYEQIFSSYEVIARLKSVKGLCFSSLASNWCSYTEICTKLDKLHFSKFILQ